MDSILDLIKKLVGSGIDYGAFDIDLITNINSSFMTLFQLGVGPRDRPFSIRDSASAWSDFDAEPELYESVKLYIYIKARLVFDPPTNSSILATLKEEAKELEWRLQEQAEWFYSNPADGFRPDFSGSYNDLTDKPSLDGVTLQGDVKMNIATKNYIDDLIGEIQNGSY